MTKIYNGLSYAYDLLVQFTKELPLVLEHNTHYKVTLAFTRNGDLDWANGGIECLARMSILSSTEFDMSLHQELSGKKLKYADPELDKSCVPAWSRPL